MIPRSFNFGDGIISEALTGLIMFQFLQLQHQRSVSFEISQQNVYVFE
jgi:hypothetical protein